MIALKKEKTMGAWKLLRSSTAGLCVSVAMLGGGIYASAATTVVAPDGVFPGAARQTRYVMRLETLGLTNLLAQAVQDAAGKPSEPLFKSGLIYSQWTSVAEQGGKQTQLGREFVADVAAYVTANTSAVDGNWAVDQAKFMFAYITPPIVDRIEYWSATAPDRTALKPIADLSQKLLTLADGQFKQVIAQLNLSSNFTHADETAYEHATSGESQVSYYMAYADYYAGLSMPTSDPARKTILENAAAMAAKWIKQGPASGVYYQALLLAGKSQLRAGDYSTATDSLQKAQVSAAPLWVAYQSRYQQVVALIKQGNYKEAKTSLGTYETWIRSEKAINSPGALMGAELLRYRLLSAHAKATNLASDKTKFSGQAARVALHIISVAPQYEQLLFSHLARGLSEKPDFAQLDPLRTLAYAWEQAQKKQDVSALAAVEAILSPKTVNPAIRREALLIGGISNSRLGRLTDAVKLDIDFVKSDPKDPRSRHVLELALYDLKQLNAASQVSPDVTNLTSEALSIAYSTYHEKQWAFAYATQMQLAGRFNKAATLFASLPASSPLYLDARYELVRIATTQLGKLAVGKAPPDQQRRAARQVLAACDKFLALLKNPPSSIDAASLQRAMGYRTNIWLIEAGTALDPLREPDRASASLNHLDGIRKTLSSRLQGVVLRYRIRQYQLENQSAKILPLIQKYAMQSSQSPKEIIEGLIGQYDRESRSVRNTDPIKAQRLATDAATLMRQLIVYLKAQPNIKPAVVYSYRQILADELIRGDHGHQAMAIFKSLEQENPKDLENFIGVARAAYATQDYSYAHSLYVRIIPQLAPGSDLFWSAYLYLIRSNKAMAQNQDATRSVLKSLYAIYGATLGGKYYHHDFERLLADYNVQ